MINNQFLLQALGAGQPGSIPAMNMPLMQALGRQNPAVQPPLVAMNNPNILSQTPGLADALKMMSTSGPLMQPTQEDMKLRGSIFEPNHMLRGPTTEQPRNKEEPPPRDFGPRIR